MITNDLNTIPFSLKEQEFIAFFKGYYRALCVFANRLLKDPQTAEDIVGEVAVKVWEKRGTIQYSIALKNYFYKSIHHACLRHLDKQKRRITRQQDPHDNTSSRPNVLENIIYSEVLQEIDTALQKLPPQCRKVFTSLYIEGRTVAETAKELHLSVSTIKSHKERGMIILRGILSHPGSASLLAIFLF